MSKLPVIMFLVTAIIAVLLMVCLLRQPPTAAAGAPHPDIPEMNQGGEPQRHTDLIVIGGLYGALQIVLLVTGLCLGIRRGRGGVTPLLIAGTLYVVMFAAMVATYSQGMDTAPIVLGLPLPTSLMVFGMWGVPFLFVALYSVNFRAWIFSDEDARRFAELTSRQDESRGSRPVE